jgi:hypothetical protein
MRKPRQTASGGETRIRRALAHAAWWVPGRFERGLAGKGDYCAHQPAAISS